LAGRASVDSTNPISCSCLGAQGQAFIFSGGFQPASSGKFVATFRVGGVGRERL
jgi:hypothetical protein